MWYEVRQEFSYENWSEGVFKTVDEAIDCILKKFAGENHGHLLTYDLVNGLPKIIGIAEIKGTRIEYLDKDMLEDIKDSDTAYTLDKEFLKDIHNEESKPWLHKYIAGDEIVFIHHEGALNL